MISKPNSGRNSCQQVEHRTNMPENAVEPFPSELGDPQGLW